MRLNTSSYRSNIIPLFTDKFLDQADLASLRRAGARLGVSTHSYWEVARAYALRPSYNACGPNFATQSKDMPWVPQGLDPLGYLAGLLNVPVVGIAGIDDSNMASVAATGAASAAEITAMTKAADPDAACQQLMAEFARGLQSLAKRNRASWPCSYALEAPVRKGRPLAASRG